MKPICVPCQRFMRVVRTGEPFLEQMPRVFDGRVAEPGNAESENWIPYKLWLGDRWSCPDCDATLIVGTGREPYSEHYREDFAKLLADAGGDAVLRVNDC